MESITVSELRMLLEELEDDGATDDTEIRIAVQPAWPFEHAICDDAHYDKKSDTAYLFDSGQIGYLAEDVHEIAKEIAKDNGWNE